MGDVRRPFLVPQPPPPASLPCSMWPLEGAHLSEGRAPASPIQGRHPELRDDPSGDKASKDMAHSGSGSVLKTLHAGAQGSPLTVPRPVLSVSPLSAEEGRAEPGPEPRGSHTT